MARLDIDRQKQLEPKRINLALNSLNELGLEVVYKDETTIIFMFENNKITYYPYSGWHTGKGIKDGRGWKKLYKQIKIK